MINKICAALITSLLFLPVIILGQGAKQLVETRYFNIDLSQHIQNIEQPERGNPEQVFIFSGNYRGTDITIKVTSYASEFTTENHLVEIADASFKRFEREFKRKRPKTNFIEGDIQFPKISNNKAVSIPYEAIHASTKIEGAHMASYRAGRLYQIITTITGPKTPSFQQAADIAKRAVNTINFDISQHFSDRMFYGDRFTLKLPRQTNIVVSAQGRTPDGSTVNSTRFEGMRGKSRFLISVTTKPTRLNNQRKMNRELATGLEIVRTTIIDSIQQESRGKVRAKVEQMDRFRFNGQPTYRQPFTLRVDNIAAEGAAISAYANNNLFLILGLVSTPGRKADSQLVETTKNSLWSLEFDSVVGD